MKTKYFLPSIFAVLLATAALSSLSGEPQAATPSPASNQKAVVHLSHFTDDLHRCFMALKVANLMQERGTQVTIFLDLEGVRLAERRQPLDLTWGSNSSPLSEHYESFTKAGGRVILCPHCAKSARLGPMGLKRNAEIGTIPMLGEMLTEADKIMDY